MLYCSYLSRCCKMAGVTEESRRFAGGSSAKKWLLRPSDSNGGRGGVVSNVLCIRDQKKEKI